MRLQERNCATTIGTPYIFDDRVSFEDVADAMYEWWNTPEDERIECGRAGRKFCLEKGLTSKSMGDKMIQMINFMFKQDKIARPKYTLHKVKTTKYKEMGIV